MNNKEKLEVILNVVSYPDKYLHFARTPDKKHKDFTYNIPTPQRNDIDSLIDIIKQNDNTNIAWVGDVNRPLLTGRADGSDFNLKSYAVIDLDIKKQNPNLFINNSQQIEKLKHIAEDISFCLVQTPFAEYSAIVISGGGIHIYYKLKQPIYDDIMYADAHKRISKSIAQMCSQSLNINIEGDGIVCNFASLMRVPYSVNWKYGIRTDVIHAEYRETTLFDDVIGQLLKMKQLDEKYKAIPTKKIQQSYNFKNDDLKSRAKNVPIIEVIKRYIPESKIKPHSTGYIMPCLFHDDKNPSLSTNTDGNYFMCNACDARGDVINFVALEEHKDIRKDFQEICYIVLGEKGGVK